MKKALTFLAGAALASAWWMTFELPPDKDCNVCLPACVVAVIGTAAAVIVAVKLASEEK